MTYNRIKIKRVQIEMRPKYKGNRNKVNQCDTHTPERQKHPFRVNLQDVFAQRIPRWESQLPKWKTTVECGPTSLTDPAAMLLFFETSSFTDFASEGTVISNVLSTVMFIPIR